MNHIFKSDFFRITVIIGLLFSTSYAWGGEIYIPKLKGISGEQIVVPIMIDSVEKLAGIKLVLKYNTDLLEYQKSEKSQITSNFLHVVNDKKPGNLVIVMASATGIKGKDISVLSVYFTVNKSIKANTSTTFEITELQLMTDDLKELAYSIKCNPIELIPVQPTNNLQKEVKSKKQPQKEDNKKKSKESVN